MGEKLIDELPATVSINLAALHGLVCIHLQRLLDILAVSLVGLEKVDDSAYADFSPFFNLAPAQNERLTRESAVAEAQRWYLCTAFRDAIEVINLFLDRGRLVCALCSKTARGKIMGADYNRIVGAEAEEFHFLGLPKKLERLRKDFGIAAELETHALSINTARNCLVHRLGIVSDEDVDANGELAILWRSLSLVKQSSDGTQEISLDEPGEIVDVGWSVIARITDNKKTFRRGERIDLSHREITHTFSTLMAFTTSIVQSMERYSKKLDIRMPDSRAEDV